MATKYLQEEIITQILYSVPAKSIGKFRSVSKGWLSLLTHPDFIITHRNTLDKHHLIFSNTICTEFYTRTSGFNVLINYKCVQDYTYVKELIIRGSCNGLVLVFADSLGLSAGTLVLFNPTTKESMQLPEYFDCSYFWAKYESFRCNFMHGLGYDSETGDFKVVSLTCVHDNIPMTNGSIFVDVYSLKTNTWRRLTDPLDDYGYISSKEEGVFVNGFLHWITTKIVNGLGLTVILAFSLVDENFSEVPSPEFVKSDKILSKGYCQLVVLGGKLALFNEKKGEIWLMDEYRIRESWTKISLHGIHEIPMVTPSRDNKPMVFCQDGKFMVANNDRMMVYDEEKGTFEETVCVWDRDNYRVNSSYVESLVSIVSCIEQ